MGREINKGREGGKIRKKECMIETRKKECMIETRQSMTRRSIAKKKCRE